METVFSQDISLRKPIFGVGTMFLGTQCIEPWQDRYKENLLWRSIQASEKRGNQTPQKKEESGLINWLCSKKKFDLGSLMESAKKDIPIFTIQRIISPGKAMMEIMMSSSRQPASP
jgi:hypothetical protein